MYDFAVFVDHMEFQGVFVGCQYGESRGIAAEDGAVGFAHFAALRCRRVDHVIDARVRAAYVLEVVDMTADVHLNLVAAQYGVDLALHVGALRV